MRISACYIVRNEAAKLERSLASLEGAVDEIIVVDTGSSDDTVKIAEAHGAQVFHFPWQDDFSAARNASLSKATGDWILVVDADEYFPEGMAKNIRPAVERYGADADLLIFMRREFDEDKGEVLLDTYVSRLLRRTDGLAYEGAIHEEPRRHGSIIARMATIPDGELMMMHTGYSAVLLRSKGERNLALLLRELESGHPRDSIYMYLAETYDGLKDEAQGLRFAWMDVMRGRKPIIFASRTYCILIRILAKHPERYQERRKATAMAVKDFPEIPEFHAEYAECLALGFAYRAAVRESKTALDLFASGVGCGMEPSMFTQETADFVRERMEMWERLALEGLDAFGDLAGRGDWKGALAEAENGDGCDVAGVSGRNACRCSDRGKFCATAACHSWFRREKRSKAAGKSICKVFREGKGCGSSCTDRGGGVGQRVGAPFGLAGRRRRRDFSAFGRCQLSFGRSGRREAVFFAGTGDNALGGDGFLFAMAGGGGGRCLKFRRA